MYPLRVIFTITSLQTCLYCMPNQMTLPNNRIHDAIGVHFKLSCPGKFYNVRMHSGIS